ncbi:hypothetical protein PT077_09015, partial [Erysipelothrix rhusiopathiae]|nr:hypothetical protein [Erysipelothrix rhusiopathiae]
DLVDSYKTKMEITHPKDGDYHDWITETVDGNIYTTIEKLAYRAFQTIQSVIHGLDKAGLT